MPSPHEQPTAPIPGSHPDDAATAPLSGPHAGHAAGPPGRVGEHAGDTVGPYKLLEIVGEGGFGTVWLAERREPMVQRVALKIIKPGMDSRAVVARFEQERQALAVMDHPNVARVFDGGVTPTGRPFFVMEHVKGEPITRFADRQRLTIRQRLELFIPVCEAVQHAHMKGIVHRDLKPSNILAAPGTEGGTPVVKVIDFGVAKAVTQTLTDKTIFTEQGQIIGTPEYMSPEQAEMGATDIDTRTDVYSLGVVLYELLSGSLPFDSKTLRTGGYAEIQRIIREVEPPRPSTRVGAADHHTGAEIARVRQDEREKLARELKRELEWIPLKALRKDRSRRYASAESLAADVRRYLEGKPLEAAPESRAYLVRKFVRRNRGPVLAAAAVSLALAAGVAATALSLRRALDAEAGLRSQLAETEKAQNAEAQRADELKKVSDFQSRMLSRIDTTQAGADLMDDVRARFAEALSKDGVAVAERSERIAAFDRELARVNATDTAATMIDRTILTPAVKTIDARFKDQPLVDAELRQSLANLYSVIGRRDAALPLQESALATRRRELGEDHPDTLRSVIEMGSLLFELGRPQDAEPLLRDAFEKCRRVLGEDHPRTLVAVANLGTVLQSQGKLAESEPFVRAALASLRRVRGEDHTATISTLNNLGVLLRAQKKLTEAESCFREALERGRRVLGESHPDTISTLNNLGAVLQSQGKPAEAEPYLREGLEQCRRVLGDDHPETLVSISNMGAVLEILGKPAEAEPYRREALEKSRRVLGEDHQDTIEAVYDMGALLEMQGKLAEAEPYFREAVETSRRVLEPDHRDTRKYVSKLAHVLQDQGKLAEAEPYFRDVLDTRRRTLGDDDANTLSAIIDMGVLLQHLNRHQDTIDLLAPAEPAARKAFTGGNARRLAAFLTTLARARIGLGYDPERFALAESNLLEAHPIYLAAKDRGRAHKDTVECVQALVDLYTAWHAAEPGKGYDAKAAEWKATRDAAAPPADAPPAPKPE